MINRKALWISFLVIIVMIAADCWRLSLLPDWHHVPAEGPGSDTYPVLMLFVPVLIILFTISVFFIRKCLNSGPEEAVQRWGRVTGVMLLFNTAMGALAEAFNLARSMGALQSVDRLTMAHVTFVATGMVVMLVGNMLPKMPWLTARFSYFQLDPWQWNQQLRFDGKLTVLFGLFMVVGMPLVPFKMIGPTALGLTLTFMAVNHWHRAKVKRESPPQP